MGSTIWIEVRGRSLKETADDCSKMNRFVDRLDEIASQLDVPKLSGFLDYTEMALEADAVLAGDDWVSCGVRDITGEPIEVREAEGEWFDSVQGLRTIRTLY